MTAPVGNVARRFRITVEGITRFIGDDCRGDVILTMPAPFYTNRLLDTQLPIGAMPLGDVEWIDDPLVAGDRVTTRAQLDALPNFSAVRCDTASGFVAQKIDGDWRTTYAAGACDPMTWTPFAVVMHVGEVTA